MSGAGPAPSTTDGRRASGAADGDGRVAGLGVVVEHLTFRYRGGTEALTDVSLTIGAGERVAIIGQNGSGKSTLVRQLNGLLRPTSGAVRVAGNDVARRRVAELAALVGLAFQNPDRQIFSPTVRGEVAFGARNLGRRRDELDRAVAGALEAVGMTQLEGEHPYDLGYSKRKLLTIASVLAMETPVVVLDEPTTGQDARGVRRIKELVTDLGARGRTVIAISHDIRFVAESFERVVVMGRGRVVLDGRPEDVFDEPAWATLSTTKLTPPLAARLGARLGLGSTPTESALVAALTARRAGPGPGGAS